MKHIKSILLATVALSAIWAACRKENAFPDGPIVQASFAGQVFDENREPLSDAQVRLGTSFAVTDKNGVFRFPSFYDVPQNKAVLDISKPGYFALQKVYYVEDKKLKTVDIQLIAKHTVAWLDNSNDSEVEVGGVASIKFQANSVATLSGSIYSGSISVSARYLAPQNHDLVLQMPGDLRAIDANGEPKTLASFGMIAVELEGAAGEKLNLANGKTAEITLPIASDWVASAPAEIPLWYYDAQKTAWVEEGKATKIGNKYVGEVGHFSFWNCDSPYDVVKLSGKIYLGDTQHPLAGAQVWICIKDEEDFGWGCGYGDTDADGSFGGGVPIGLPLTISVVASDSGCTTIYNADIGLFNDDTVLPDIILPTNGVSLFEVKGRLLDCNNQPLANGYAQIETANGFDHFAFTDADGAFSTNIYCFTPSDITVTGYDAANLLKSLPLTVAAQTSPTELGEIKACIQADEYIRYALDGQVVTLFNCSAAAEDSTTLSGYSGTWNTQTFYLYVQNNQQTGTFPVSYLYFTGYRPDSTQAVPQIDATFASFGNIGEAIIGTLSGTFKDSLGGTHNLTGSYRVIRDQ